MRIILHSLTMHRSLRSTKRPLDVRLDAPASKSVTHRALVAAALAEGVSTLAHPLDATDTRATVAGLSGLGIPVSSNDGDLVVQGQGGFVAGGGRIILGESGTSLRLLTAVAALGRAASRLDGSARLRERPLAPLTTALRSLGAGVGRGPGLPLEIGGTAFQGGTLSVPGSPSSQFASALMLIGPCLPGGLGLVVEPPVVSRPYIELTVRVMREFGVDVECVDASRWNVPQQPYRAATYAVEGDHSSASTFMAAALIAGGRVRIDNLDPASLQADACLPDILERLGAEIVRGTNHIEVRGSGAIRAFDVSLGHAPDLVPTIAVLGAFADGLSVIRDVPHLRLKESDRLHQLAVNLRRLGRVVEVCEDRLEIGAGRTDSHGQLIETAGDHRIAMAFALAALRVPGLRVDDADCVGKSYPQFWRDWGTLLGEPD